MAVDDADPATAAADAFDVLSDPSRVAILRELTDLTLAEPQSSVEFAELRRAVGFEDAGRFNYHLGKLQDRFVVKRDGGYVPTAPGMKAIGSIASGTFTDDLPNKSGTVEYDCPACGDPMEATYDDQLLNVECSSEDDVYVQTAVPPAAAKDATIEEIVSFVVGDVQRDLECIADGVCPMCSGQMNVDGFERGDDDHLTVETSCGNCWMRTVMPVGVAALRHPAVVSLYYDHGVDVRRHFVTDFEFVGSMENAELVSDDPPAVELRVAVEDDELTLRVDADLAVREV
ncbi:MAG: hypothetical protein ABEJ90_01490 [Halobacterium sp.]